NPAGEISLEATYSATANYPAGRMADPELGFVDPGYLDFVPENRRVPGYNWSVSYAWLLAQDAQRYRDAAAYRDAVASHEPIGALSPWDPGYQALMAKRGSNYLFFGND